MGNKKSSFYSLHKMYVTFKINECATGKDVRLSSIISEGKLYKVPGYFNFTLDENSVKYSGTNLSFEDALERTKSRIERQERIDKMNPSDLSKEFKENFSKIYLEKPKRVIEYMNNYDLILETGLDRMQECSITSSQIYSKRT